MHASTSGRGTARPRLPLPRRPARPVRAAAAAGGADSSERRPSSARTHQGRSPSPTARAALPAAASVPTAPTPGFVAGPAPASPVSSSIVPAPAASPARGSTFTPSRVPLPRPRLNPPPPVGGADLKAESAYLEGLVDELSGLEGEDKVRKERGEAGPNFPTRGPIHPLQASTSHFFTPPNLPFTGRRPPRQCPGRLLPGRVQVLFLAEGGGERRGSGGVERTKSTPLSLSHRKVLILSLTLSPCLQPCPLPPGRRVLPWPARHRAPPHLTRHRPGPHPVRRAGGR
jgi:hypothetical protein